MTKKILGGFAILVIAAITAFNVNLNTQKEDETSWLVLANAEALTQKEDAFDYESIGCRTERCMLLLGGGMFTSSVKRTCYIRNDGVYSSCSSKECGEVFYGCY